MHKIFVPNSIIKVPKKKNTCKKQLILKIYKNKKAEILYIIRISAFFVFL